MLSTMNGRLNVADEAANATANAAAGAPPDVNTCKIRITRIERL
jgi:hypothetical protein